MASTAACGGRLIKRSSDGEQGNGPGYAGISTRRVARRARSRAGGRWGTVAEGFEPRAGAARAPCPRAWASPCRGGERTSGIRRRRALWRAESDEGRACTSRSSTQVVSPRAGTRCVPGLRRTWPARARNAAHRARACCRAWPRAVLMHSARFWFRAARILGDQASCQWPGGMWGVGGACAVETACKCYRHCPADLVLSRALAGKVPGRLGTHRAPATQVVSPRAGVRCVPSLPGTLPASALDSTRSAGQ